MKKNIIILQLVGALTLAGCVEPPVVQKTPPISFTQQQPIALKISRIEVVEEYKTSSQSPHVEHLFPTTPLSAAKIWLNDRIRVGGGKYWMQAIIKDASVVETKLPLKNTITGAFTNEQEARYDARMQIELRMYGEGTLSEANVEVTAQRSTTVAENDSLQKRDQINDKLLRDLMADVNRELEKNISQYFGKYRQY